MNGDVDGKSIKLSLLYYLLFLLALKVSSEE